VRSHNSERVARTVVLAGHTEGGGGIGPQPRSGVSYHNSESADNGAGRPCERRRMIAGWSKRGSPDRILGLRI
jgi:hypothetical protein